MLFIIDALCVGVRCFELGQAVEEFSTSGPAASEPIWERVMFNSRYLRVTLVIAALLSLSTLTVAQSLLSGDISGTITDPSGAVIPGATVNLKSLDTGATQSAKTNADGVYRFSLLKPGRYSVSAARTGFQPAELQVEAAVGQVITADLQLPVGQSTQTIEVTDVGSVLNPEPSNNTSFSPTEIALLPNAGGDITNIAFTAPGVVVNNTGGYGNFTVNGLPATSNLFTVNGENDMDPYFNINNSGATNLTLGQNEIQEATVIANPYGGQYGQLSGAQVILVTKSGSNTFHGNAQYWWNGRDMNANDWFNNFYGTPRPFSNANQWASSLGGPIKKNKTFFFVDTEGLRFVLPNVDSVTIPTQAFANAVLNNIAAVQPNELPAYKTMLGLWENAPGAGTAQALPNSSACATVVLPGFNGATTPCAAKFEATPTALAKEWILAFRIDQKISDRDNAFYRYRLDHGVQPTTLDPINSNFDALSNQPAWDNQFQETHIFGPTATNQFIASFSHYVAQFAQNPAEVASTFPYQISTSGAVPFTSFNAQGSFPQGRNITQYQFIDDITVVKGKHTLKFGENYRRYDVSDHNFFYNNPAVYFGFTANGMQNFVNGLAYQYRRSLNVASDVPIALWGIGAYAHDDWRIKPNLTLTLGFRVEHGSNPVCQINCFSNFKGPWNTLASVTNPNPGSVPYSADFNFGQHQAFQGVDAVNIAPSVGFSWSPFHDRKTVISGGFGVFYDSPAAGLVDSLLSNPPVAIPIRVRPAAGILGFDSGPKGGAAVWQASANAFNINDTYTQLSSGLAALGSVFAQPSVYGIVGTVHSPRVLQWNFQIQRELTKSTALIVNYVGNHSGNIPYSNQWLNAFDEFQIYPGVKGIPAAAPDNNYGVVTQYQSGALANYAGLQVTFRKAFSHNVAGHFNYTWSHALDEVSNGGLFTYGDSILGQLNPGGLALTNYGNADYDIRHQFSADFVYTPVFHVGNKFVSQAIGGWQLGSKIIWRSGLPISITDNNTALGNYSGSFLATQTGPNPASSCGEAAANAATPCLNANAFLNANAPSFNAYTALSAQTRNQFRAPHYFDLDMNLFRVFAIRERAKLSIGMQAFNLFNHPNFSAPDSGVGDTTFGNILSAVATPTSPYGNFLGFDSSPRVIQLTGKFVF